MLFVSLILLFQSNFFLILVSGSLNTPTFDGISLDPNFLSLIKVNTYSLPPGFVDPQYDPVIFGKTTLGAICFNLASLSGYYMFSPDGGDHDDFDDMVERNFYRLVKKFGESELEKFVKLAFKSDFAFQMTVINAMNEENLVIPFTGLIRCIRLVKGAKGMGVWEKQKSREFLKAKELSFFGATSSFIKRYITPLFANQIISSKEWINQQNLIDLSLDLTSKMEFVLESDPDFASFSLDIPQCRYLLQNFSIVNENEIDMEGFQKACKDLRNHLGPGESSSPLIKGIESFVSVLNLFFTYSNHLLSPHSHVEISEENIDLFCLSFILTEGTDFFHATNILRFDTKELVFEAIKNIELEIIERINSSEWSLAQSAPKFVEIRVISDDLVERIFNFYVSFAKDPSDWCNSASGFSKRKMKIYLHLLLLKARFNHKDTSIGHWIFSAN